MPGGQGRILPLTFVVLQIFNSPENQMQELVIMTEGKCAASTRHFTDLSAKNQVGKMLITFKEITHHHKKRNKLLL